VLVIASPARAEDVKAAIDAAHAKMEADYAAGDSKALAEAYTEDAVMLPPDATRVEGRKAIAALWKSWLDEGLKNLKLKSTEIESAGDLAYEVGDFSLDLPGEGESYDRGRQLRGGLEARRGWCLAAQGRHVERRAG
jgi:uncharacterized protein (TIGR02246 family)